MSDLTNLLPQLSTIIRDAGDAIMAVYESSQPLEVENKSDDSPVTKADLAAHHVIQAGLESLSIQYPILSEEGGIPSYSERQNWDRYWLVDPLDGTKEFINHNGEFTVNIALIEGGDAILGLVYVPVTKVLYVGLKGEGAWKEINDTKHLLQVRPLSFDREINIVGSRRHGADALNALLTVIAPKFKDTHMVSMGSSLKICALAEGTADWYPRLALTCEWDTAAAHAVLNAAGGEILNPQLEPLKYNQKDELLNPFFHGIGDQTFSWQTLIPAAE